MMDVLGHHTSCKLRQLLFLDLKRSLADAHLQNMSGDSVVLAKLGIFQVVGEESMKLTGLALLNQIRIHFSRVAPMFSCGS